MSLTIYGKTFSGPRVHMNDPSGTVSYISPNHNKTWFVIVTFLIFDFVIVKIRLFGISNAFPIVALVEDEHLETLPLHRLLGRLIFR